MSLDALLPLVPAFWRDPSDPRHNDLKGSVAVEGVREPIVLVRATDDGRVEIQDGYHRIQVSRELGLDDIPVVVYEGRYAAD